MNYLEILKLALTTAEQELDKADDALRQNYDSKGELLADYNKAQMRVDFLYAEIQKQTN